MQHYVDYRVECSRRQGLGSGNEIAGCIVDQTIETTLPPNRMRGLGSGALPLGDRSLWDFLSPSADHQLHPEFKEARALAFADAGTTPVISIFF
jgi:hypothetical protein